jgi:putative oxidoreductase
MFAKMCATNGKCASWALTVLRVVTGLVLLNHGWPKLFGDAATKAGMLAFFESTVLPAPGAMLMLAGALEVVGGILLIVGAFTAITSLVLMLQFAVIILFVKLSNGFSSMELDLFVISSLLVIYSHGAGSMGVESMMSGKKTTTDSGHGSEAMTG